MYVNGIGWFAVKLRTTYFKFRQRFECQNYVIVSFKAKHLANNIDI